MKQPVYINSNSQPWGLPLLLAVGVHLLALLPVLLATHFTFFQPRPAPEIQTVSLFRVADLPTPAPLPAAVPQPRPTPEPEPQPAPESIPEPVQKPRPEPEPPLPVETPPLPAPAEPQVIAPQDPVKVAVKPPPPISTRPLLTNRDSENLAQLRERLRLDAAAREAARRAELARRQALEAARNTIRSQAPVSKSAPPTVAPPPSHQAPEETKGSSSTTVDAATREYLSLLHRRIQAHWMLPNLTTWDHNMLATIVVTVRRDGSVRKTEFEKRAENMYFNQLVQKAIRDASPLPPFPAALRQNEMEIGLNFRPGEIF